MSINVSVVKSGSENSMSLIRRFTKRVQGAGIVRKVKGIRYYSRAQSKNRRKMSALRRITKHSLLAERERMGLIQPKPMRGGRR